MLHILMILMVNISLTTQANQLFVASDSLFDKDSIIILGSLDGWRFHPGDDLAWSDPDFDDSDWILYRPAGLFQPIPDSLWDGYGWFRFRFAADSSAYAMVTNLYFFTRGAAEVYLDGKLVHKFGAFSTDLQGERLYTAYDRAYPPLVWQTSESHVLAVRYSYHKGKRYKQLLGKYAATFGFDIGLTTDQLNKNLISSRVRGQREFYILSTMLILVVLLHGLLFALFPAERSNLYITILVFLLFLHTIISFGSFFYRLDVLQRMIFFHIPYISLFMAALSMFPLTLNSIFYQKPRLIHKLLILLFPVVVLANFLLSGPTPHIIIVIIFPLVIIFFSFQVLIKAWRNKQQGVWIVAVAFLCLIISAITIVIYNRFSQNFRIEIRSVLNYLIYGSVPLGLTVFMSSRFRDLYTGLENKVRERTRELRQSLDELRSTQTQLIHSEKMASLGELTAGIAHEIQNPLNFVNNFSEVSNELIKEVKSERLKMKSERDEVLEEELLDDIAQNLDKIHHHGKRADAIVKGMLQHSRSSTGQKEPADINVLADEYLRLAYHGMRAKDKSFSATFHTDFDPNLPKIEVVLQDIGRVILNLVNNAFQAVHGKTLSGVGANNVGAYNYTPLQGLPPQGFPQTAAQPDYTPIVTISTKNHGDHIEIRVADNGPGIPDVIKDKIFQPFFTTKPTGQGTGLGLSLSYDIVKAHGGEIQVHSVPGDGSEFKIVLPCSNQK